MVRALMAVGLVAGVSSGCDAEPRRLPWFVSFPDTSLRDRAATIEATIFRGGCDSSDATFETVFAPMETGAVPSILPPGEYGFAARARDDACVTVAAGCNPVELPLAEGADVETIMLASPGADGCGSGEVCRRGACEISGSDGGRDATLDAAPDAEPCDSTSTDCRLAPSNVDPSVSSAGATDLDLTADVVVDTTTCDDAALQLRAEPMREGPGTLCVMRAGQLTIAGGVTLRAVGVRPLVILAEGPVDVDGTIDLSARRDVPGAGGGAAGTLDTPMGAGPSPGEPGVHVDDFADGGGGGGGLCGAGGSGGSAGLGAVGGRGGDALTDWQLSPLTGGSGGGLGASSMATIPPAGAGGGAVQITSQTSIRIGGSIVAGGGGGGHGLDDPTNWTAASGGGSGGAVLLEARTISLGDSGAIGVSGGGGGGSADGSGDGGPGEDGGLDDAARGRFGGGTASAYGGPGSTATMLEGGAGEDDSDGNGNGGGGGGGAGCILFRTADGTMPTGIGRSNPVIAPGVRALPAVFVPAT